MQVRRCTPTGAWLFWLTFGLSLALHAGTGLYLLLSRPERLGATPLPTAAISVNLESTDVLDAAEQSAVTEAAAAAPPSPKPSETEEVKPEETPPPPEPEKAEQPPEPREDVQEKLRLAEEAQPKAEEERQRLAEETERKAEEERLRLAEDALRKAKDAEEEQRLAEQAARRQAEEVARRVEAEAVERAREEARKRAQAETRKREAEKREAEKRQRAQAAARSGASGSQNSQSSAGRVSASQGAISNYGSSVRARIYSNTSRNPSSSGVVTVAFTIAPSGQLASVRVARSSGNGSIDQLGLAALRQSSPFPPPPGGSFTSSISITFTLR